MKFSIKLLASTIFLTFFITNSCKNEEKQESFKKYYCDSESINNEGFLTQSSDNNILFSSAKNRTKAFARSGQYSVMTDSLEHFAFTFKLRNYKPKQHYKVSVWRHGSNTEGILVAQGNKFLYETSKEPVEIDSAGWEKLELDFYIPQFYRNEEIIIYAENKGKQAIYFDDLTVEQIEIYGSEEFTQQPLRLYIDDSEMYKLKRFRQEALEKGILETQDESWVKAIVFYEEKSYEAKVRLKGDWLDHLQGVKWSFRIKIKNGEAWKGMRTFSIQTPYARHFLDEWFVHKIFEKEDVLTPRYGFVPVQLNGNSLGIYSYEEHFEKQLVESKNRREGPIVKLSEEAFWALIKLNDRDKVWANYPLYETSKILPFKESKTVKNKLLYKQFLMAQNLIFQYKNLQTKISEIFDAEKLARYHAIVSLAKIYHSQRWHNQRFYYDPVIQKCEIIGFDCFMESGAALDVNRAIYGDFEMKDVEKIDPQYRINYYIFEDSIFVKNYVKYLKKYSDTTFLNNAFAELDSALYFYEKELKKEFRNYKFDRSFYYENAENIRKKLPAYIEKTKSDFYKNLSISKLPQIQYNEKYYPDLSQEYIHAYLEEKGDEISKIRIINYNPQNIFISGHKITQNPEDFNRKIKIGKYGSSENEKIVNFPTLDVDRIYFTVEGSTKIHQTNVMPWPAPSNFTARQELTAQTPFPLKSDLYKVEKNKIIFNKGKQNINKTIIIPENYEVYFNESSEIDITDNASFISYSAIFVKGSKNNPVKFISSDKTAKGILILQAEKKSIINFAVFDGFNTFTYKNWGVTGAINFYESDVEIENTIFKNNSCEDMLNIIRSHFKVTHCILENTFSDAFDSDFCTGELSFTQFISPGNDAIDFSGSKIHISNCQITNAGDKGISGGEASTLKIENCSIIGAKIGIASKDNTILNINNCTIENTKFGLAAYIKKPEYGPAYINCNNIKIINVKQKTLLEENSTIIIDGQKIPATEKNLAENL